MSWSDRTRRWKQPDVENQSLVEYREVYKCPNGDRMHPMHYDRTQLWVWSFFVNFLVLTGRGFNFTPDTCEILFIFWSFFRNYISSWCIDWTLQQVSPVPVSGPSSTADTLPFFTTLSPNQVPNFNKTQINTNYDWYERPLSNPQVYLNNLPSAIILFKKIGNKRGEEHHVTTQEGFMTNRSFKCSPYLWINTTGAQKITEKKRQSNTHAHAHAILESKSSCLSSLIQG